MFTSSSRYVDLPTLADRGADGEVRLYKARRLIRREEVPGDGTTLGQSERLDQVAHRTLRNPERFWRLCDVNRVMNPFDLQDTSGSVLAVPEY